MAGRDLTPPLLQEVSEGVIIRVRVHPRASKVSVGPVRDGLLSVRLTAPPAENAANRQCIQALAEAFGVRPRQVTILSGQKGREKRVRVEGVDARRLGEILGN
ncbi:MAG: DUF167 domain-containing protein [Nitrospinota bacterium]